MKPTACPQPRSLSECWEPAEDADGPCVCVCEAHWLSSGAIIQHERRVMCSSCWRWMRVLPQSNEVIQPLCLSKADGVSSRNRAYTDWWESNGLWVPSMQMEQPAFCSVLSLKWSTPNPSLAAAPSFLLLTVPPLPLQSQMTTTRSSGDIAMDLTEICAPRIIKLSSLENQLIMASNGSLISAGKQTLLMLHHQDDDDDDDDCYHF